ncbi:MAG: hypothetical protein AAGF46_10465, partial [Pseudomonadota bacterium]
LLSVLLVQVDKLAFSGALPLAEFGYLAVVGFIATGLIQLSGPIGQALLPRLTALHAQGEQAAFRIAYLEGAEAFCLMLIPLACTVALFAQPLLAAWTGSADAAAWGHALLFWYALGNALAALASFHYFLQYAHGVMRYHLWWLSLSALVQSPVLIVLVLSGETERVAAAWFAFRLVDILLWSPWVHNRFEPGLYMAFLRRCLQPLFISLAVLIALRTMLGELESLDRLMVLALIALAGAVAVAVCSLSSAFGRRQWASLWQWAMGARA